jgi:protein-arginine kinase activator protein McsA
MKLWRMRKNTLKRYSIESNQIFIGMTPEEFFHFDKLSQNTIYEMRILSLGWVLKSYRDGRIRKNTITNLIQQPQLEDLLNYLIEQERYEECAVVRDILNEVYTKQYERQD